MYGHVNCVCVCVCGVCVSVICKYGHVNCVCVCVRVTCFHDTGCVPVTHCKTST